MKKNEKYQLFHAYSDSFIQPGVTEFASHLSSGKWEAFFLVGELFRISFHMNYEVEAGVRGEPILYGGDRLSK